MAQVIHLTPDECDKGMRQQLRVAQKLGDKSYLTSESKTALVDLQLEINKADRLLNIKK
ncbi:MAG: hypothetical protein VYE62_01840 [Pseudomonadota bacterium]|nr:hypothetical protein [Pseudomonadota bacterium]